MFRPFMGVIIRPCILKKLIHLYWPDDDLHGGSKHVARDTLLRFVNIVNCVVFDGLIFIQLIYTQLGCINLNLRLREAIPLCEQNRHRENPSNTTQGDNR
jgi:hypothetical protein